MELSTRWYGDAAVIRLGGRLDHNSAPGLTDELLYLLQKVDTGAIVIDLSDLEYMSSAGLKSVLMMTRAAKDSTRRTFVAAATPLVQELLEMTHAKLVLQIVPTVSEAVRMVSPMAAYAYREAQPSGVPATVPPAD
jgi:stage II sporulation protein AA (anti-sigma F factor antagonist)